ncbi:pucR C-terminal helix-turn-helix domain protein [Mycobacteroides abscessus]|nr:pucR C-terminal helix-turn-helix domain protein [Mycobacteroides abscessus]
MAERGEHRLSSRRSPERTAVIRRQPRGIGGRRQRDAGTIVEHDAVHGSELMTSLRAYLEANGHWESAATVVGVHRHTLRKRIETVQSLLACDLDIARVRAELLLAMLTGTPGTGN